MDNQRSNVSKIEDLVEKLENKEITREDFEIEKKKLLIRNTNYRTNNKNSKNIIITLLLWSFSITGLVLSLVFFTETLLGGIVMLFSALLIFPPIIRIYKNRIPLRIRYTVIISAFLLFISAFIFSEETTLKGVVRLEPRNTVVTTEDSEVVIKYDCEDGVEEIKIDNGLVSEEIKRAICTEGYLLKLEESDTRIQISFKKSGKTLYETLRFKKL
jgi:hypothetical protein